MLTATDGEMRWTAILSTDMVGFAQITQEIGSEGVYALLQHVLGIAREIIAEHGGTIVDTAGDGLLAAFGAPQAVETASSQICIAARKFHDHLESQGADLEAQFGVRPVFRSGIAGGNSMIVREGGQGFKVVGDPVNLAARLQAKAAPGEILISDLIYQEAEGAIEAKPLAGLVLKGFEHAVQAHRLTAVVASATRFEARQARGTTEFVSREDDLKAALGHLQSGDGLLLVTGVAGIGKSRLVHEIGKALGNDHAMVVGQCAPGSTARSYGPIFDILGELGGVASPAPRDVLEGLHARFPDVFAREEIDDFVETRSGDDQGRVLRDRAFLTQLIKRAVEATQALVVIEDAHWIDPGTEAVLSAIAADPVALVVTGRPVYAPTWVKKGSVMHLALEPLSPGSIRNIARLQAGGAVSDALGQQIIEKSEGIPLIAEEIMRALRSGGKLKQGADGLDLASAEGPLITGNLEHLVMARVDELPAEQKTALQVAAAIGRDFSQSLLEEVGGPVALADLPGLIEARGPGNWRFAHALLRDAVYGSLLDSQRKDVHRRIATALGRQPEAAPGLLAQHYLDAGMAEQALPFLIASARDYLAVYALDQACQTFETVMDLIEAKGTPIEPELFDDMTVMWLLAHEQRGDFHSSQQIAERAVPRMDRGGYTRPLSIAKAHCAMALTHLRDYDEAEAIALEALSRAEAQGDAYAAAYAKLTLTRVYEETYRVPPEEIERLVAEIIPVAQSHGDRHLEMTARYQLSSMYRSSGKMDRSQKEADDLAAIAETHDDRRAKAYGLWARAMVHSSLGQPEEAQEVFEKGALTVLPGTADETVTEGIQLFVALFLEPPETVRPRLVRLWEQSVQFGDYNLIHLTQWMITLLDIRAGRLAEGWRENTRLMAEVEATGHVSITNAILVSRAEILLMIAGVLDLKAEIPADRPQYAPSKPGVADMVRFLTLKLFGMREAEALLRRVERLLPVPEGANFGRVLINRALIAKAQKRSDMAHDLARRGLAEVRGIDFLERRAQSVFDA